MAQVQGVHGLKQSETFLVNIALPNKVIFTGVRVTKGELPDADVLVGMDIICRGDFAVTNAGGVSMFSFRVPSQVHIDFVEETNRANKALVEPQNRAERRRAKRDRD